MSIGNLIQQIIQGIWYPKQYAADAGGKPRVLRTTLFDGKILNADDSYHWENVGTGTGTWSGNKYNMSVTSGQYFIRQSKRFFPYFAGKSQDVQETGDGFAPQANVVKRQGYFSSNAVAPYDSDKDGFWVESGAGTITLNCARLGTMTLNALPITSWSGYHNLAEYQNVANWDNFTVAESKFLWLGGAVLVWSIKTSRGFVEAHRFDYAGTAQDVMMSSPNQPVRYEIRSTTGTGSYRYICSEVATEGSIGEGGNGIAVYNASSIACNSIGTIYALMGLKKQTAYRDTPIQISDISVANTASSDAGIMLMIINPTLSAALTYANESRFQVAYATNQTITAGTGRVIAAMPITTAGGNTELIAKNYLGWLASTITNTSYDEFVLAYLSTTVNQSVNGIINLKEY